MARFDDKPLTTTARPVCSKCYAPMWLTRIQPDKPGCARRTFECPRCQDQMTEVIELENAGLVGKADSRLLPRGTLKAVPS